MPGCRAAWPRAWRWAGDAEGGRVNEQRTQSPAPLRLHLGCGPNLLPGWVNVDFYNPKADQRIDLFQFPWPWATSSADEIFMSHFLEHFDDHMRALQEVHRVLKPGGRFRVIAPHAFSSNACSLGHRLFCTYITFRQLTLADEWFCRGTGCVFEEELLRLRVIKLPWLRWTPMDWLASRFPHFYEKCSFSFLDPTEIEWIGRAVKKG